MEKRYSRILPVALTFEDLSKIADQIDFYIERLEELENEKRNIPKRIESAKEELFRLRQRRNEKTKPASVECEEKPDFTLGLIEIIRLDTGEAFETRTMTDDDRQDALFENPAVANNETAVADFFANVEPAADEATAPAVEFSDADAGEDKGEAENATQEPIPAPEEPNPLKDKLAFQVYTALMAREGALNRWTIAFNLKSLGTDAAFRKACAFELSANAWLRIASEDCCWKVSKDNRIKFFVGKSSPTGTPTLEPDAFVELARRVLAIPRAEADDE